jgi:hypothetical protein
MNNGIGSEFLEKTKYKYLGPSPQQTGAKPPALQVDFSKKAKRLDLPEPLTNDFKLLVDSRQSVRRYSKQSISMEELSYLLWCTQGVRKSEAGLHTFRTVPSAGARHALETLVLVNRVASLEPLLYQYLSIEHKLTVISHDNQMAEKNSFRLRRPNNACEKRGYFHLGRGYRKDDVALQSAGI